MFSHRELIPSNKFHWNTIQTTNVFLTKCIWKLRLQIGGHFVQTLLFVIWFVCYYPNVRTIWRSVWYVRCIDTSMCLGTRDVREYSMWGCHCYCVALSTLQVAIHGDVYIYSFIHLGRCELFGWWALHNRGNTHTRYILYSHVSQIRTIINA